MSGKTGIQSTMHTWALKNFRMGQYKARKAISNDLHYRTYVRFWQGLKNGIDLSPTSPDVRILRRRFGSCLVTFFVACPLLQGKRDQEVSGFLSNT